MADQPQNSNSARIQSMLQDLAAQKESGQTPQGQAPASKPPANLPVTPPPAATPPPPAPKPVAPPPAPATPPAPRPAPPPPGAVAPPRPAPPPAPVQAPVTAPKPLPPPPAPPKPAAPPAPKPSLPPAPKPPAPPAPPAAIPAKPAQPGAGFTGEVRTMKGDVGQLQVGKPPEGVKTPVGSVPAAPTPAPAAPPAVAVPAPLPASPAPITAPPAKSSGMGRKLLWGAVILIALVLLGVLISSMFGGNGGEEAPTPTATPGATPTAATLAPTVRTYLGNPRATANLGSPSTAGQDFANAILTADPIENQVIPFDVRLQDKPATAADFMELVIAPAPDAVLNALGSDWTVLVYGQPGTDGNRLVVAVETRDASAALQAMQAWESSGLATAAARAFSINPADASVPTFSDGMYRDIPMRYQNYPGADKALDWMVVLAPNGKNYLVLAGSKEAAFYTVDQLSR